MYIFIPFNSTCINLDDFAVLVQKSKGGGLASGFHLRTRSWAYGRPPISWKIHLDVGCCYVTA